MVGVKEDLINDTLRSLMKSSKDFVFVKDINLVYRGSSPSFALDCIGLSSVDDVIGKTDYEIFKDKSLANKYRNDDEDILANKKPVVEYKESYPDKEGRKRYCLTTKYLIVDKDGNSLGILGHSVDITDKVEMQKKGLVQNELIKKQYKIFGALRDVYNAIVFFDYLEDYYHFVTGESVVEGIENKGKIDQVMKRWMVANLSNEDILLHGDFFDREHVRLKLTESGVQSIEVNTIQSGWLRISLIPVDRDQNGIVTSFLWVSEKIEKEIKTRGALENRIAILNAFKNIYNVCLYWNLSDNTFFKVAGDDNDGRVYVDHNKKFNDMVYEWIDKNIPSVSKEDYVEFINPNTISKRLKFSGKLSIEIKSNNLGWIRNSILPVTYDIKGNVTSCLWVVESINGEKKKELEQKEALKNAKRAAETDSLTKILNRGGSEQLLNMIFTSSPKGLLILFDVDEFKHINDRYGHSVGDMILRNVADVTKRNFRKKDIVARFGGDEFVVFVDGVATKAKARKLINNLLSEIEDKDMSIIGNERLRISVGALLIKESINYSFATAFQLCDIAMYRCKDNREYAYCLLNSEGDTIEFGPHRP